MSEYYKLYRKSADEADKLFHQVKERDITIEGLEAEVERLKGVLGKIADGDVPREAVTIWRADGIHSKHDKCGHERVMYDDCDNCTSEFARSALGERP